MTNGRFTRMQAENGGGGAPLPTAELSVRLHRATRTAPTVSRMPGDMDINNLQGW